MLALAVLLGAPGGAHAALVSSQTGELTFGAGLGEINDVTISRDGSEFVVVDRGAALDVERGCRRLTTTTARCTAVGVTRFGISLEDSDDRLTITAPVPAQILAGSGDDTVTGGPAADLIFGMLGADDVSGGGGDDTLLELDDVGNRLDGGPGNDQISGSEGPDVLLGGPGDDPTLAGREGDDVIDGGDGDDVLDPGSGPDLLGSDADRLAGGPGTDLVTYHQRVQGVRAAIGDGPGDGAPLEGDDILADVERLAGTLGDDVLTGGPGPDVLDGRGGRDALDGGAGDDRLLGGSDDNAGDSLTGGPGADVLDGGPGGDRLAGGDGTDTLDGATGGDDLDGGADDDALTGGEGDDRLDGGLGADGIAGGPGVDVAVYPGRTGPVEVTIDGAANDGEVTLTGDGRQRTVEGARSEGDNVDATIENATGGGAADTIGGGAEPNTIAGESGEDVLSGGGGADVLSGGSRSDTILARDGVADRVTCGSGYDYVIADERDRIAAGARCEFVDDATRSVPRARRDVVVDPRCTGGADAEISPPDTTRAVPLGQRALVPLGARVDSLDCAVRLTVATRRGRARTATLGAGSGEMMVTQRRAANGDVRTELRSSDCPRASASGAVAKVARFPQRRYRRRYGRIAFPVTVRLDAVTVQARPSRGAVSWEVDDRCGKGATVRVTSGRLAVVALGSDRRIVLGPGQRFTAPSPQR